MSDSMGRIEVDPTPVNIYAHPDFVFIDHNVSGCITLARGVKKVVYGSLQSPSHFVRIREESTVLDADSL